MKVTLENVRVMEKEVKMDKEGNPNYILHCYQPGEKSLIPVKGVDFDNTWQRVFTLDGNEQRWY